MMIFGIAVVIGSLAVARIMIKVRDELPSRFMIVPILAFCAVAVVVGVVFILS